jgi:hypothetical protein
MSWAIIPLKNNFEHLITVLNHRPKNAAPKKDYNAISAKVGGGGTPTGREEYTVSTVSMSLLP